MQASSSVAMGRKGLANSGLPVRRALRPTAGERGGPAFARALRSEWCGVVVERMARTLSAAYGALASLQIGEA